MVFRQNGLHPVQDGGDVRFRQLRVVPVGVVLQEVRDGAAVLLRQQGEDGRIVELPQRLGQRAPLGVPAGKTIEAVTVECRRLELLQLPGQQRRIRRLPEFPAQQHPRPLELPLHPEIHLAHGLPQSGRLAALPGIQANKDQQQDGRHRAGGDRPAPQLPVLLQDHGLRLLCPQVRCRHTEEFCQRLPGSIRGQAQAILPLCHGAAAHKDTVRQFLLRDPPFRPQLSQFLPKLHAVTVLSPSFYHRSRHLGRYFPAFRCYFGRKGRPSPERRESIPGQDAAALVFLRKDHQVALSAIDILRAIPPPRRCTPGKLPAQSKPLRITIFAAASRQSADAATWQGQNI